VQLRLMSRIERVVQVKSGFERSSQGTVRVEQCPVQVKVERRPVTVKFSTESSVMAQL